MAELHLYEIPHRSGVATVKLSDADAEALYGDTAKKVGPAYQGEPQPVHQPDFSVEGEGPEDEPAEKKAPPARNKARSAANK